LARAELTACAPWLLVGPAGRRLAQFADWQKRRTFLNGSAVSIVGPPGASWSMPGLRRGCCLFSADMQVPNSDQQLAWIIARLVWRLRLGRRRRWSRIDVGSCAAVRRG